MTSTIERIDYLLKDDSMPSMILLDGSWGSGKTHFIKNKLEPHFKKKSIKVVFFSLYGVSDLNDFRCKLSSAYLANNPDVSKLADSVNGIAVSLGKIFGENTSGSVGAALSGMAGMAQHAFLANMKDFTLILDDLERLSSKNLIKQILGESIELADNNKISVIIAANTSQINDKNDLEKAFIDTVTYRTTAEKMVDIALEHTQFNNIRSHKALILNEVKRLNFTNLRILKRAIYRLNRVFGDIDNNSDLDMDTSVKIVTSIVLSICYAHYEAKLSTKTIKDNLPHSTRLHTYVKEHKSETEPEENTKAARRIFNLQHSLNDEVVDFCIGDTLEIDAIEAFCLPKKSDPLSALISYNYLHMNEPEFIEATEKLQSFIKSYEKENYAMWIRACDVALYLSKFQFIDWPRNEILNVSRDVILKKTFAPISTGGLRLRFSDDELQKIHEDNFERVQIASQKEKVDAFTSRMKKSWLSVEDEAKQQFNNLEFLQFISGEFFKDCILRWDIHNINAFEQYIYERINSIDSSYWLNLNEIVGTLEEYIENEQEKLKRGILSVLCGTLKNACNKVHS
ncbi:MULTISPECIES: P-loop NTPase fold protein [Aliivibrio]|uniref:KAP NTPase domain-containing protein n=1 Tax=Aliivibrio finisterrensis TaxID=511998 RepID=A0A4Q5KYH4_9GAMM|nr:MULTISPECIES: P-loop NTPase fold protein [Aliivibrio]MDD9178374.1 P-loop NTPase fold protein [Aliivibrio sp. A6]RYU54939.1 hypothetical protein ERW57_01475 [Aliivibrio finisterrensis]RYU56615.1 hypothetical protein ERW56_01155 [Aliivibrio finisterrensis]RYU61736.1 hypothetical protein ERW50_01155 [Aliivibrio finisterrensis]RYU66565.1 hypothetical protein ERW53_02590 [Aliivibrio finisterrensis]